ncbi:MAG TPA: capsule assembly Wzi family protein [Steroidobacteraceae bacterium]|nr:capsule assembly Wzi family protein [Steroidobacteraceae bacterium]
MLRLGRYFSLLLLVLSAAAFARGVTPYLPLNLDPEVEREVERVLVLGDKPVMTRPIPAALVLDALPKACRRDAPLCERVRSYLRLYMHGAGIEFASLEASASGGRGNPVMPDQHGETEQSHYQAAAAAYLQPSDYLLLGVGGIAYQGRFTPTGSVLSLGFNWAQLDLGWRDHWWSPMTDSSMLLSTEAPTMPSVTLSNYTPLTRLGLQYEIFAARMSKSDKIELTNGTLTTGYPKVAGLHLGLEPIPGWSIAASRILVFGGGAAGGQSIGDVFQAFFNPSKAQSTGFGTEHVVGKQEASVTSRFIFPGPVPFAVYMEYAGNDTDAGRNYLLGKPDLSVGVHFPRLGPFDLTFENSYWAPTWYVHGYTPVQTGYGDGITNDGLSFGHWFGDQRVFGDAVGGRSDLVRLGWEPAFGGRFEAQLRALVNDSYYSAIAYRHEYMASVSYSRPWREYVVGTEIDAGRDVFGGRYSRFAAFMRYGDALHAGGGSAAADDALGERRSDHAELFVDAGVAFSRVQISLNGVAPVEQTSFKAEPHIGFGARREASAHQDLGFRVEADDIDGRPLYTFRALDYRYRFDNPLALSLFGGAARYNLTTPAYGFVFGAGVQWRNLLPGWDLGLDYLYGIKVARLREPNDTSSGTRPDSFYNIDRVTLYLSRKF